MLKVCFLYLLFKTLLTFYSSPVSSVTWNQCPTPVLTSLRGSTAKSMLCSATWTRSMNSTKSKLFFFKQINWSLSARSKYLLLWEGGDVQFLLWAVSHGNVYLALLICNKWPFSFSVLFRGNDFHNSSKSMSGNLKKFRFVTRHHVTMFPNYRYRKFFLFVCFV